MRITPNQLHALNQISTTKGNQEKASPKTGKSNYDEITIHAPSEKELDRNFISNLKSSLLTEIQTGTSPEKMSNIIAKIETDTYQVDAGKLAERLLFYKGAESDE